MIQRIIYNFLIVSLLLWGSSCIRTEDFKNPKLNSSWDPSFAIPIISSNLRVIDAVNKADTQNIYLNSEGYYTIRYRDTVFTLPANEIIAFPDQNLTSKLRATNSFVPILPAGNTLAATTTSSFQMSLNNGMKLKNADLSGGNLNLSFSSDFKHDVTIEFQFTGLVKNGVTLSKTYDLSYTGSTPVVKTDNIDLNGYTISTDPNYRLPYTVKITLKGSGNSVSPNEFLQVTSSTTNLKYSKWVGNAGSFLIPVPEGQVQVGVFNQAIPVADISLVKPSLTVKFINSFGIPSFFGITKLYSTTAYDLNTFYQITTTAFSPNLYNRSTGTWTGLKDILYPAPSNVSAASAVSVTTPFVIDNTNSNLVGILNPAPKFIHYGTSVYVNGSSDDNYIRSDSKLSVFTEIDLPLYGYISVYGLADTFNISLPTKDNVKSVTVRLFTDNSIPIRMNLQGYFLDSLNHKIDSLVTFSTTTVAGFNETGPVVAEPAIYDANGNLISNVTLFKDFVYPYARYATIAKCKKMILKGDLVSSKVSTPPTNYNFKITPNMKMTVKLSMKIDLTVNP
ncbi:MAG: hypothetical protein K2Q22_15240 [Cytophagales bacterium]|nr:hypothetical protein [Cytophagales bacterium]